jgi:hypothetical protein
MGSYDLVTTRGFTHTDHAAGLSNCDPDVVRHYSSLPN